MPPSATVTGWNNSLCASTDGLFYLDVPAVTTKALPFMVPLPEARESVVPDPQPSQVFEYLNYLNTVQAQMHAQDLLTCSPTSFSSSCPTSRPASCPANGSTTVVTITNIATATAFISTVTQPGSFSSGYSITIKPPPPMTRTTISQDPCVVTTSIVGTTQTVFTTAVTTVFEKPTRTAVSYTDEYGDPEIASYTPKSAADLAPESAVADGSDDTSTTRRPSNVDSEVQPASTAGSPSPAHSQPSADEQATPTPGSPDANQQATPTQIHANGEPDSSALVLSPTAFTLSDGTQVTYTPRPIVYTTSGTVMTYVPAPTITTVSGTPVATTPTPEVLTHNGQTVTHYPPGLSSTTGMGDYIMSGIDPAGSNGGSVTNGTGVSSLPPQFTGAAEKVTWMHFGELFAAAVGLVAAL